MKRALREAACLALLSCAASGARAAAPAVASAEGKAGANPEWPQFRGPFGSGVAPGDEAGPVDFGIGRNQLFGVALPVGHSSPVVWGDTLVVTAYDPDGQRLETLALDRHTGRVLWRRQAPPVPIEKTHAASNPAAPTPVTDGRLVIVYFGSYGLIAYDLAGNVRWSRRLPMAKTFKDLGTGSSPLLADGVVLQRVDLGEKSHLLAVRAADGETVWQLPTPEGGSSASPVAWKDGAATLVGIFQGEAFTAHDLADGRERFRIADLPDNTCATPSVSRGVLYLTGTGRQGEVENLRRPPSFDEMVARYDRDGDGRVATAEIPDDLLHTDRHATGGAGDRNLKDALVRFFEESSAVYDRELWDARVRGLDEFARSRAMQSLALAARVDGDAAHRGEVLWRDTRGVPEIPSPLFYRDRVYVVKNGGIVIVREASTGRRLFEGRLGAPGGYYASPVAAGGRIYLASDAGVVTVLDAQDAPSVRARADLGEPVFATPALVDGTLYVRTTGHLFAFREPDSRRAGQR